MKVVIFAGGLGTRMGEESLAANPKPMVPVAGVPVLVHLMNVFARQGFSEFVVLAGYRSQVIKNFFLDFRYWKANLRIRLGDGEVETLGQDLSMYEEWSVEIVDTGLDSQTERRLWIAQEFIGTDEFYCTYGDGLANVNLSLLTQQFNRVDQTVATLTSHRPPSRFGILETGPNNEVFSFREKPQMRDLINIGFMHFSGEVWNHLSEDNVAIEDHLLPTLARKGLLTHFEHQGFWQPMDTPRELKSLNEIANMHSTPPWLSGL